MIITLISDTHSLHEQINVFLPGGHLLLHGGDITNVGFFSTSFPWIYEYIL